MFRTLVFLFIWLFVLSGSIASQNSPSYSLSLDLSGLELESIPDYVFDQVAPEELILSGNAIRHIPPEIGKLTQLRILDLRDNQIQRIPEEIGNLPQLLELDLSGNQLSFLDLSYPYFTQLNWLDLSNNKLRYTLFIGSLTQLTELNLANNQLSSLPIETRELVFTHISIENNPMVLQPIGETILDATNPDTWKYTYLPKMVSQQAVPLGCETGTSSQQIACLIDKINSFIIADLKYPSEAREKYLEGTVVACFTVDSDGKAHTPGIIKGSHDVFNEEMLRNVQLLIDQNLQWIPATYEGENVAQIVYCPMKFKLE